MTGRSVENVFPARRPLPEDAEVVLAVEDLGLRGAFTDVSFDVRAGEVVGLAGLVGSGRSESSRPSTARKATSGTVSVGGRRLKAGSVNAAVEAGVGLLPRRKSRASSSRSRSTRTSRS